MVFEQTPSNKQGDESQGSGATVVVISSVVVGANVVTFSSQVAPVQSEVH